MSISQDEKIDYIYDTLKKQESRYKWSVFMKWGFRIFMVVYLYYFIVVALPGYISMFKESMTPNISNSISESINGIDKNELINKFKGLLNK